ncbi:MAG: hypothetical protein SXG53_19645 [Pseudomonadota bacterium]|nr:hypothetical protein [Pseudomonadota bacterium]
MAVGKQRSATGGAVFDDAIHPPGRMGGAYSPDDPSAAFWRHSRAPGAPWWYHYPTR